MGMQKVLQLQMEFSQMSRTKRVLRAQTVQMVVPIQNWEAASWSVQVILL